MAASSKTADLPSAIPETFVIEKTVAAPELLSAGERGAVTLAAGAYAIGVEVYTLGGVSLRILNQTTNTIEVSSNSPVLRHELNADGGDVYLIEHRFAGDMEWHPILNLGDGYVVHIRQLQ